MARTIKMVKANMRINISGQCHNLGFTLKSPGIKTPKVKTKTPKARAENKDHGLPSQLSPFPKLTLSFLSMRYAYF